MSVPKKDGKVSIYIDFHNLNKAYSKDDFPLLHIDVLIDNTICHPCYHSWMIS